MTLWRHDAVGVFLDNYICMHVVVEINVFLIILHAKNMLVTVSKQGAVIDYVRPSGVIFLSISKT